MFNDRIATDDLVWLFERGTVAGHSDWQLLDRFVGQGDERAFEALVSRHGPMVLGICRRLLGHSPEAEDAFQATFLVLLKKARALGPGDAIAAWLHGVAVRVAKRARADAARRGRRETPGLAVEALCPEPAERDPELRHILDEEIHHLPFKYRAPIVLCYLEDQTHEEAARQLQWPVGTVKGRLARARKLLESRLTRRGVACSAGLLAAASPSSSQASVSAPLFHATCRAAAHLCTGKLTAPMVSAPVARLLQGVLSAMLIHKVKVIALMFVVSGLVLTGAGVLARQPGTRSARAAPTARKAPSIPTIAKLVPPARDEASGAPAKSESELYREIIDAARQAFLATSEQYRAGHSPVERVYHTSRLLMEAERDAATEPSGKIKAVEEHQKRMMGLRRIEEESGDNLDANGTEARAYLAEADLLLAQARSPRPASQPNPVPAAGPGDKPGKDPRSLAILTKLEEPVAMSFPNETPLDDVLKYIKHATQKSNDSGIPIYVDPQGLQEADKSLTSPIQIDLEGVPLRRTLQLLLKQLGLTYFVDDGILVITSESEDEPRTKLGPSIRPVTALDEEFEKVERGEMKLEEMKTLIEFLKTRMQVLSYKPNYPYDESKFPGARGENSPPVKPDQLESLTREIKELRELLKSQREKSKAVQ
jgi:RNA polymerase sigma factor (sigma-70 family)